ncbi:pesticin C-terminus-like muramidase [Massilia scottii]|uniref:pesticin C-terminus-like muramidase n=1 Tax=Massilia scottii TaxID=3057166 RepID=UPI002796C585|nr:pesticin C-terminus-like muramidase [Massilia sp. CCM 9029]MDQ1834942.1 pesticin C-terminus-like muramidase [Massilia sp. CCM 9029]
MVRKTSPPPQLVRTEENLPDYDKDELRYERELIARVKACGVSAKLAKSEMAKLSKQKSELNRKDQNFKADAQDIASKIKIYEGIAITKCRLNHPGCVPSNDARKIATPKSMGEEINKNNKTKIDFEKLSEFEGGEHTVSYIPWWPYLKKDRAALVFYSNEPGKNILRLAGEYNGRPENRSGATIGIGVDLGQDSPQDFLQKMKKRNTGMQKFSDDELNKLHEKIKPYFEKIGGEACKFLRENPLVFSARESHFLNKVAHEEALQKAMDKYRLVAAKKGGKKFTDLTSEQQTALLSNGYQKGTPDNALINAIIHENRKEIPERLREHAYLFASMHPQQEKGGGNQ